MSNRLFSWDKLIWRLGQGISLIESSHFPSVLLPDGLSHLVPFLFCFAFFNFPFRPPGYFVFFCQIIGTLVLMHPILFDLFEEPCCCSIFLPVPFFHLLWLYLCVFLDYGSVFVFVLVIVFFLSLSFSLSRCLRRTLLLPICSALVFSSAAPPLVPASRLIVIYLVN